MWQQRQTEEDEAIEEEAYRLLLPSRRVCSRFGFIDTPCPHLALAFLVVDVLPGSQSKVLHPVGGALRKVLSFAIARERQLQIEAKEAKLALELYAKDRETKKKISDAKESAERSRAKELTFRPVISEYAKTVSAPRKTIQFFADGLAWRKRKEKKMLEKREKQVNEQQDNFKDYCNKNPLVSDGTKKILAKAGDKIVRGFSSPKQLSIAHGAGSASNAESRFGFAPMISLHSELLTADLPPVEDRMAIDIKQRRIQLHEKQIALEAARERQASMCKRVFRDPHEIEAIARRLLSPEKVELPPNPELTFSPKLDNRSIELQANSPRAREPLHTPRRRRTADESPHSVVPNQRKVLSGEDLSSFFSRMELWTEAKQNARRDKILGEDELNTFSPQITPYKIPSTIFSSATTRSSKWEIHQPSDQQHDESLSSQNTVHTPRSRKKMKPYLPQALTKMQHVREVLDPAITAELHAWFHQIACGHVSITQDEAQVALRNMIIQLYGPSALGNFSSFHSFMRTTDESAQVTFADFVDLFENVMSGCTLS